MNNKGANQTAQMCRLICAYVVHIWQKKVFSWRGSYSKPQLKLRKQKDQRFCFYLGRIFQILNMFFWRTTILSFYSLFYRAHQQHLPFFYQNLALKSCDQTGTPTQSRLSYTVKHSVNWATMPHMLNLCHNVTRKFTTNCYLFHVIVTM